MTAFNNYALAQQIEAGEVFYGEPVIVEVDDFTPQYFKIVTDANQVSLRVSVVAKDDTGFVLTKGGTMASGSSVPIINMNRNVSDTFGTTIIYGPTASSGAAFVQTTFVSGETSPLTPVGLGAGVILEPSTTYVGYVIPICGSPLWPNISFFLRNI